jgi:hypothetical protein
MGLSHVFHDFLLLPELGDRRAQYAEHINDPAALKLSDALVDYMLDTLCWVPSENPAKGNERGKGLNLYGPTTFTGAGAAQLAKLLRAWAALFGLGPEMLDLTGEYWTTEGDPDSGQHERIMIPRSELVETLEKIADLADKAVAPEHWLLHMGI